ncbi:MAG: urea transporter [Desulfovibrio sp.]|nr:urea transporter [Desulfovibrio sp.]
MATTDQPRTYVFSFQGAVRDLLRGSGQVMFQQSAWTGLLFLAGIFWGAYNAGAPQVAWGAVVGLIASSFAGWIIGEYPEDGQDGLWGFNGILVGCAFPTFLAPVPLMWIALIFCSMLTTWMRRGFNNVSVRFKINSLTFPFVFLTWVFLLSARVLTGMPLADADSPALIIHIGGELDWSIQSFVIYWLKGISQVFLINNAVTGLIFLVGLGVCSLWAAVYAAVGSAVALAVAIAFAADPADVTAGLFGFSPVLTAIALGCTFYKVNWRSALWAITGVIATVFIQAGMDAFMAPWGLPTLTGPFCVATWLFLLPLYKLDEDEPDKSDWKHTGEGASTVKALKKTAKN